MNVAYEHSDSADTGLLGYDRTAALASGEVRLDGVDLTYLSQPVEETFFRMLRHREFDAAEMSLSSYVISMDMLGGSPFVAIPVFPSHAFRHNGIYVHAGSGIQTPGDLRGRTVGVAEYQLTANVWIRGILAEHYGVPVASVKYRTGGQHSPGRVAKVTHDVPADIDIAAIPADRTLVDMLVSGEIDALYTPRTPLPFAAGRPEVRRLFPDVRAEEERYFAQTQIFPVMHVVVIRRDVYEARPWLAQSLFKAFEESRRRAADRLAETAASRDMLPWLYAEAERTTRLMGRDYWTYGLDGNEAGLSVFLRYAREQGLLRRDLTPADLFAPETLESYVI